ncbi:MAG TPA: glucosaminidase domain-containing protein [Symbiobacteriaceae bacterium]|jgi:hypothetical protein
MMPQEWARSVKDDLVHLQQLTGIPALWAAAQHCHEGFNDDGSMSRLFAVDNNGAGLKWADWQEQYGCTPVTYPTQEWDPGAGRMIEVNARFCHCPSWDVWLQVYAHLLSLDRYLPAYQFKADPYLFGAALWAAGYATDPRYLAGRDDDGNATGIIVWLMRLWPIYVDTLPAITPGRSVEIRTRAGGHLAMGWLMDPDGPGAASPRTVAFVRELEEAQGLVVEYDPAGPAVILDWPGMKPAS